MALRPSMFRGRTVGDEHWGIELKTARYTREFPRRLREKCAEYEEEYLNYTMRKDKGGVTVLPRRSIVLDTGTNTL
jgi:hypothetical protein